MPLLLDTPSAFSLVPAGNLSLAADLRLLLLSSDPTTLAADGAVPQLASRLGRVAAVQVLLADAPLIALGLVGFGLGTFWLLVGGMGRAELCLILSTLTAFFAAVFDLSQVLIVRGPSRTPTALVVAQQTLLALSSSLRLAFLLLVASRCPPREAWARELASSRAAQRRAAAAEEEAADGEPKTLRSGFDDDDEEEDHARAVHSGLWSACSSRMLGRVLRLKAWMLVVAVAVLSLTWRLGSLFVASRFRPVYTADLAFQLVLAAALALKMLTTARLSARRTGERLVMVSCDYGGPLLGLGIGAGVAGAGLTIVGFSETPVGRFLQVLELYTLSISQLLLFFRSRDHRSLPPDVLAYLASTRTTTKRPPCDGAPSASGYAHDSRLDVPRHPSPARRASGGLANWLREVPHLLAAPSASSSSTSSDGLARRGGAYDVELGAPGSAGAGAADFRTPRSALGRDLDLPLTAGLTGRHPVVLSMVVEPSAHGDALHWGGLARPEVPHLISDGTFRPLDMSLGNIRITNADDDDAGSAYSRSSASATSDAGEQALLDIGRLAPQGSTGSTRSSDQGSSRFRLPRLPTISPLGPGGAQRMSEEDGELLINGSRRSSSPSAPAPPARASGLSLPPLGTLLRPPPAAAVALTRNHLPSDVETSTARTTPTQSVHSHSSAATERGPSMDDAARVPPTPALPARLQPLARGSAALVRRASVRASSASGQSWSTSNGIASMYLESFPTPPPPHRASQANLPTPSKIGVALGGPDTDLQLSALSEGEVSRMKDGSALLPPRALLVGQTFGGRQGVESLASAKLGGPLGQGVGCNDDVDVTSFIAGPRDTMRDSTTTVVAPRLRSPTHSMSSPVPHSPATIHRAQLLVRKPSLKVANCSRSGSSSSSTPRAGTPTGLSSAGSDDSHLTPTTVDALPAAECLRTLSLAVGQSNRPLSADAADIPAVVLLETMLRDRSAPQGRTESSSTSSVSSAATSSLSASPSTVDSVPLQTPAPSAAPSSRSALDTPTKIPAFSSSSLARSVSFKYRISSRARQAPSPAPLSLIPKAPAPRRPNLKNQLPSWRGI